MPDYLQPAGRAWRMISIVACTLASIICWLLALFGWGFMVWQNSFELKGQPLWIAPAIFAITR